MLLRTSSEPFMIGVGFTYSISGTATVTRVNGSVAGLTGARRYTRWAMLLVALVCPLAAAAQGVPVPRSSGAMGASSLPESALLGSQIVLAEGRTVEKIELQGVSSDEIGRASCRERVCQYV